MFQIPNCGILQPVDFQTHDATDLDARGQILIFEPPSPRDSYVVGVDPTGGLVNWTRSLRNEADSKTDNGAIEVIKRGLKGKPDIQVAEYAAPNDPEDLAPIVNFLGRLYCGTDESEQAPCIIEVYPGPGFRVQDELINRFHYYNFFRGRYVDSIVYKPTNSYGWVTTPKSLRELWGKTVGHIKRKRVIINSPWLVEEMSNISMKPHMMWGESVGRKHDDRLRAFMLSLWMLHDWNQTLDLSDQTPVEQTNAPSWQATAITEDDMYAAWEDKWEQLSSD